MNQNIFRKKGSILITLGLLLIAAALVFTGSNFWEQYHAEYTAKSSLEQLLPQIPTVNDDKTNPDYKLNPNMDMPEKEINGYKYIGVLKIPQMNVKLPVASSWSNSASKIALCRYFGSAYLDNMIIAGHNYINFFGGLKRLKIGDKVTFTDVDGNIFHYKVADMEVLASTDIDGMQSSEWPLTLFTCTIGGQSRITIRCEYA